MSWMDDGGFEMQAFTANAIESSRNWSHTMTSHDQLHDSGQTENTKPNYTFRRLKFAVAIIGFVSSMTLLFTWHVTDRHMAWLVAGIYILTGLWLTVRFAPRD